MAGAQRGDRADLEALLRRHVDRIHALCRRLTGNDSDASDATQEALIAVVRGLPRFDGRSQFATWAYRVATNACLDELRRRKRRPMPMDEPIDAEPARPPGTDPDLRLDIEAALVQLPVEFRAAVVLRDLSGFDYAEIADVLGVPTGTVKSRIARGRAMLAELLGGNPAAPTDRRTS